MFHSAPSTFCVVATLQGHEGMACQTFSCMVHGPAIAGRLQSRTSVGISVSTRVTRALLRSSDALWCRFRGRTLLKEKGKLGANERKNATFFFCKRALKVAVDTTERRSATRAFRRVPFIRKLSESDQMHGARLDTRLCNRSVIAGQDVGKRLAYDLLHWCPCKAVVSSSSEVEKTPS